MVKELKFGDIIWLNFTPQSGHEQAGRRPALVVSNDILNSHSNMVMVCPITTKIKPHPFHISLGGSHQIKGEILCEQVKMLDVIARNYEFIEKCDGEIAEEARRLIISFLETE